MDDHGPSFELFAFVEDNPKMDEHAASYIFRQVGLDELSINSGWC
jgi:hypothetical protein